MKDEWIIRRHARQLCDAGVDLIVLDNTNDHIYEDVFCFIADVFRRMRAEGRADARRSRVWPSQKSVELLWDKIYSRGLYADLWFRWKGKPLLLFGQHVTGNRQQVNDVRFPKAITDFFTIRQSWAWTTLRLVRRRSRRMALGRPLSSVGRLERVARPGRIRTCGRSRASAVEHRPQLP